MAQPSLFQDHYAQHRIGNPATCAGKKTASSLVVSGRTLLTSIMVGTDGANDATLTVYDSTSASGTIVRSFTVKGSDLYGGLALYYPVYMNNGIYAALSGTGASYVIDYIEREL